MRLQQEGQQKRQQTAQQTALEQHVKYAGLTN